MYILIIICAVYIISKEMKKPNFSIETALQKIFGAAVGVFLVYLILGGM